MPRSFSPILFTGGAGFIGSALVRQWLKHEESPIVNFDALTYAGLRESLADVENDARYALVEGDVADAELVGHVLAEHRPCGIIHLAAETHVDRSIVEPPQFVRTNVLGTCAVLDRATSYWQGLDGAARAEFRFLLVSTDEVFGSAEPGRSFSADDPLAPSSPYAAAKAAGEHLARAFAHTYGLPVVTINPTNNYGPRQMPEKMIPRMILAAARGELLPVYGDGLQERDWLHVDDCSRAIRAVWAHGKPGRRYLAGADNCLTNLSVVERICDLVDQRLGDGSQRRRLIAQVEDRPGHDRRYAVDARPLRDLGWRPSVEFAAGLSDTVAWYLENADWTAAAAASLVRRNGQDVALPHHSR